MLSLKLTRRARTDIQHISRYTTEMWGKEQAVAYKELLAKHFAMLQANPSIGHSKPGLEEGILCVRAGRHLIFYETQNETVYVLRILHDSMDYARHLN